MINEDYLPLEFSNGFITNAWWYTPNMLGGAVGIIGIVAYYDTITNETKYYIGCGEGKDAVQDILSIAHHGSKFHVLDFDREAHDRAHQHMTQGRIKSFLQRMAEGLV